MNSAVVPAPLIEWLQNRTREEAVINHRVFVNLDWWNTQLVTVEHRVTGTLDDGSVATHGKAWVRRGDLFELANQPESVDPIPLLWSAVAWGTGTRHRLNRKRISSVYQDLPWAEKTLRNAYLEAAISPRNGFLSMRGPGSTNAFKFLGPAFFTKVLYFAGAGRTTHPCLIVDDRVLSTLRASAGKDDKRFNYRFGYPVSTYESAVGLMAEWANAASSELGRDVAADEVERWAFVANGQ